MARPIRVRAVNRTEVDLDKLAFALLRFAEQLTPAERDRLAKRFKRTDPPREAAS
ncbi:MAG: hypothetical protein QOK43_1972 [Acidimicrobiaceae bacterium]|nr:hypothetical protein [Acidimicrobiaceae bacterium]